MKGSVTDCEFCQIALFLHVLVFDKMLAMKKNVATKERQDQAVERQTEASGDTREENSERTTRSKDDKTVSTKDMDKRARKSYHNDGPGGSYGGY